MGSTNRSDALMEEIEARMKKTGITVAQIAGAMGCTRENVYARLRDGTTPFGHRSIMDAMDEIERDRKELT